MKIALLIKGITGGGSEKICLWLAGELQAAGHDVTIITLEKEQFISPQATKIKLVSANCRSLTLYAKMGSLYNNIQFDLIITFGYELSIIVELYRLLHKKKFKTVFRNPNTASFEIPQRYGLLKQILLKTLLQVFLRKTNLIVHQCAAMQKDFKNFIGQKNSRNMTMTYISNPAVKHVEAGIVPKTTHPTHFEKYFIFVGRLEAQKNVGFLIRSFAHYVNLGGDLNLRIVGNGHQLNELKDTSEKLGLGERIEFCGHVTNPGILIQNAKAVVLTSKYEGFPNILLEAIAMGVPVISTNFLSGAEEIVINKINGYLVESDEILFSEALLMTQNNIFNAYDIKRTSERFSPELIASQYIHELEKLLR